jgi:uncharacterized membrane protein YkgB
MENQPQKKLPWWHVVQSVLSAFLGVQSKNRADKDFQQGNFKVYAAIGIIAVIVFILTIVGVVKYVTA